MRLLIISAAATILLAGFAACNDDDTTETGAGGGAATGTGTGSTPTGTTPTGTTSTGTGTNPGCGGGPTCEQLCDDAQAKVDACFADAGVGQGGAGGGGTGLEFTCDEEGQCLTRCIDQYSCLDIVIGEQDWNECYFCCKDPYGCV